MAAKKKKTPKKSAKANMPALIPQPNGKGALLAGGIPGNKGGGRPKSEVRAAALEGADVAIPFLKSVVEEAIEAKKKKKDGVLGLFRSKAEAIAASKILLQFGLGTQTEVSVDDIRNRLSRQLEVLREELPAALLERVLTRLKPIWTDA
jgi:hypothetical protein